MSYETIANVRCFENNTYTLHNQTQLNTFSDTYEHIHMNTHTHKSRNQQRPNRTFLNKFTIEQIPILFINERKDVIEIYILRICLNGDKTQHQQKQQHIIN